MSVFSFLTDLERRQIHVWIDGDQLRCNAPTGVLTPLLHGQLKERKHEILAFLRAAEESAQGPRAIVPLRRTGTRPPVFAVPGHNGDVFTYRTFVDRLGPDQPFYGLQPPGLDAHSAPLKRVEPLADYFAEQIRASGAAGPCIVAAYCAGGAVAFELAQRLQRAGTEVRLLALFGCGFPTAYRWPSLLKRTALTHARRMTARGSLLGAIRYLDQVRQNRRDARAQAIETARDPVLARRAKLESVTLAALRRYTPTRFDGHAALFVPNREWARRGMMPLAWQSAIASTEVYYGPDGTSMHVMLRDAHAPIFVDYFQHARDKVTSQSR